MPEPTAPPANDWGTRLTGAVCVLSAQFLFGTTFAFNKWVINTGLDPLTLAFLRMVFAALILFPFYLRVRDQAAWTRADWGRAVFVGGFACAFAMILEYIGTKYTTASNVSLIVSTEAVFAVFLAVLILRETLQGATVIGGLIAFAGVFLIIFRDIRQVELHWGSSLIGDLLVLTSVILWGLYTVFSKRIVLHSNPIYALYYVSVFTAISLGILCVLTGLITQLMDIELLTWLAVFYLGAFCSGLGHLLYYQALKRLPASVVSLTLTLLPVFGVTFAIIILGEVLTPLQACGGLAIITGVAYAIWPRGKKPFINENKLYGEGA